MWYDDRDNLVALGEHLVDTYELRTPRMVLIYFEKPQKWTPEWLAFEARREGGKTCINDYLPARC